jgi:type IX secretion system PorP/SprF family membrane protein
MLNCFSCMNKLTIQFFTCVLFYFTLVNSTNAQQEPLITQFWNAQNYFNPATVGLKFKHEAVFIARNQWAKLNNNPLSQLASYAVRLKKIHGGIGVNYLHETGGFSKTNKLKFNYAYHLKLKNEGIISFGLSAGVKIYSYKPEWVQPVLPSDPALAVAFTDRKLTTDLGLVYSKKRTTFGISATQLNTPKFSGKSSLTFQDVRHYYAFANHTFGKEDKLQFTPQVLYRTDLNFNSLDVNLLISYKSSYYIGITYRNRDAIAGIVGYDIRQKYRISFSYDVTRSKLNNGVSGGSYEFVLGCRLK